MSVINRKQIKVTSVSVGSEECVGAKPMRVIETYINGCHDCPLIFHKYEDEENIYCSEFGHLILKIRKNDTIKNVLYVGEELREKIRKKYKGGFHKGCQLRESAKQESKYGARKRKYRKFS